MRYVSPLSPFRLDVSAFCKKQSKNFCGRVVRYVSPLSPFRLEVSAFCKKQNKNF